VVEILAGKDPDIYDEAINNPVLLGPAGAGKSAIAKGLALLIARKDPLVSLFHHHRVVYVELGKLQAGTGSRGSFETRIQCALHECAEGPPTILFLDELHIVMGLGRTEGSSGMEEILKPVLAEGLSCIGATTTDEWRTDIERRNPAFARRWVPVMVNEPNVTETLQILNGGVDDLARRHLVYFPPEVLNISFLRSVILR
jgi:ATP-dependent Clp protease ATP-binding subunit ClpB